MLAINKRQWEKTIKRMKIDGNHYYLNKEESDIFRSKYNTSGYPAYMILGKDGSFINRDAPRPSSDEIYSTLKQLVK